MLQISELYIYPIKSLPGMALKQARVTEKGFEHDRRWMLVNEHNFFISQREYPQLIRFNINLGTDDFEISHPANSNKLKVLFNSPTDSGSAQVMIWDDTCTANFVSNEADEWFSSILGFKCRLVHMPDDCKRQVDPRYAPENSVTSFADAYPFLIIGRASLNDLNQRLAEELPIDRFRPNIVFTGGTPYQEDLMASLSIGQLKFYGVKLCARCIMTTINQQTGAKAKEPLKTLASYRFKNNKILFGQNLVHEGEGMVNIGDELKVTSVNQEDRFIV